MTRNKNTRHDDEPTDPPNDNKKLRQQNDATLAETPTKTRQGSVKHEMALNDTNGKMNNKGCRRQLPVPRRSRWTTPDKPQDKRDNGMTRR
jgi:hypothetical protein